MAWRRLASVVFRDYPSIWVYRRLAVLICFTGLACACGYAKGKPYAVEGTIFPSRLAGSLQEGMTSEEVEGILGRPFETTSLDNDRVRWRYYAVHRQDEEVILLGRTIRRIPYYVVESEVILLFRNGLLEDISSRERRLDG